MYYAAFNLRDILWWRYLIHSLWIMCQWINIIWITNICLPHEVYHHTIFKPVCFGRLVMDSLNLQGSTQSLSPTFCQPRLIMGKGFSSNLKIIWDRGVTVPGALRLVVLWAHFVLKDFQLFHFHNGRPILISLEGQ